MRTKPPAGTHSLRVLAVGDSPGIRRLLQRWLGDAGHEVRSAIRVLMSKADKLPIVEQMERIRIDIYLRDNIP